MFQHRITVEWGDCDEAGIGFYPNYFYWLDCTWQRLLRHCGLGQRELRQRYGALTPLVEVGGKFRAPIRYDDVLEVSAAVSEWQDKRFRVTYRLAVSESLVFEGFELRAWAALGAGGELRGVPVDPAFRALLELV